MINKSKLNELRNAKNLIKNFCIINNIQTPKTYIKNELNHLGEYLVDGSNRIYVNIKKCAKSNKTTRPDWIIDNTIQGVLTHEFGHYLHIKHKKKELNNSFKRLKEPTIHYHETDIDEDIAESIRLFILNPVLLKLGRPKRYDILKRHFIPIKHNFCQLDITWLKEKHKEYTINWINQKT